MIQLLLASSSFQVTGLAAMLNDLAPAERRVLVLSNNSSVPELGGDLRASSGAAALLEPFDQVVSLNEAIEPVHPRHLTVVPEQSRLLQRYLRSRWNLGDAPVELVLESLPNAPGGSLARIFDTATISMHADGLMSYGPLRNRVPDQFSQRLDAVYYPDLVPGLLPLRLGGHAPRLVRGSLDALREVFERVGHRSAAEVGVRLAPWADGTALVLGQYLTDLGIIGRDEESLLHLRMIDEAAEHGCTGVVFKPHPAASPAAIEPLRRHATVRGLRFETSTEPISAETLMEHCRPALVVSCFSTALITARFCYDIDVRAVGAELIAERTQPYENSNRLPLVLADALCARGFDAPARQPAQTPLPRQLQELAAAVVHSMQPEREAHLRERAVRYLGAVGDGPELAYFRRERLGEQGLPGGTAQPAVRATSIRRDIRATARRALRAVRRISGTP